MEVNWLSYMVVIVITTFIVSIITENIVIKRMQCSEGVNIVGGKCILKQGYVSADAYIKRINELENKLSSQTTSSESYKSSYNFNSLQ
jgi:hypothetical protein